MVKVILMLAVVLALLIGMAPSKPRTAGDIQFPACATEDSENCLWDASTRGNGQGRSFVRIFHYTLYV